MSHEVSFPLPNAKQLDGELIPEPKLLQIYVGRKWQVEMFSLFRPPTDALNLLQAEVVAEETIIQNGIRIRAKRIEYRELVGRRRRVGAYAAGQRLGRRRRHRPAAGRRT